MCKAPGGRVPRKRVLTPFLILCKAPGGRVPRKRVLTPFLIGPTPSMSSAVMAPPTRPCKDSAEGLPNVKLLPIQPSERFNELMNCADIHLLPQRSDAADLVMPSKLTGMLATGRPVVACASPGTQIADVVAGHGIVVPPGDVDAFHQAIMTLASDPQLRRKLGQAARQYAVTNLGRDAILRKFFRAFEGSLWRRRDWKTSIGPRMPSRSTKKFKRLR